MQTFTFIVRDTFIPNEGKPIISTLIDEYTFKDNIDFSRWKNTHFWIDYDERIDFMDTSDTYEDFFEWLSELPEDSFTVVHKR